MGENQSAPLSALFLLEKGLHNRIEPVGPTEAVQRLLRNILFFADDPELVKLVFSRRASFLVWFPCTQQYSSPTNVSQDIIR